MGKMFMDRGATPPTENPHVDPQREREGLSASTKRLHQQIWSAATFRLGHNSEGAHFNQARFLPHLLSRAQSGLLCAWKEKQGEIRFAVAEALWDSCAAERKDWSDTHTNDDVCSAGMVDIDWYLLNTGQEARRSVHYRGVQLDSVHLKDCGFFLASWVKNLPQLWENDQKSKTLIFCKTFDYIQWQHFLFFVLCPVKSFYNSAFLQYLHIETLVSVGERLG